MDKGKGGRRERDVTWEQDFLCRFSSMYFMQLFFFRLLFSFRFGLYLLQEVYRFCKAARRELRRTGKYFFFFIITFFLVLSWIFLRVDVEDGEKRRQLYL